MFPVSTLTPDYSQLDSGIRVLVRTINGFGLPTYYSCEGHGADRDFIQSPYPFVVVTPRPDQEGAWCWLRFMGMLGIYNSWRTGRDEIRWVVIPTGNPSIAFSLRPAELSRPLADMQRGVRLLACGLKKMDKWYACT